MGWLRRKILNWLHPDQVAVEPSSLGHDNPLLFALGHTGDRHYTAVPVENGFALITRAIDDYHSPVKPTGPRAVVTFCPDAENLGNTIIAKMAHHKLTAR